MIIEADIPDKYIQIIDRMIKAELFPDREGAIRSLVIQGILIQNKKMVDNLDFFCQFLDELNGQLEHIKPFMEK